eukprot:CAMPEP_0185588962 /NCGR_PEP_ID=MMETSP0434-20130131/55109_1 /TAXON_ID=626734 ORGANISM="Favella taraikaensis, Strain Fe Narragansett Bay" /NCGR_SAMPLE_ID=MMETSP0434 /ASSEMBLY_ACC=CAM_ASM_000379 /LENGTH=91 /DNA_ID=CAMNT_0028211979 /DNA_START=27 /DNA_END=298 /DNA_ORIENTATION=+
MSKSTRFLSLSGLSGVIAGIAALGGAWATYQYLGNNFSLPKSVVGADNSDLIQFLLIDAALVLAVAIGFGSIFTLRKAKNNGQSVFDASGR